MKKMKNKITWVEPELVELNSHLRDVTEGSCIDGIGASSCDPSGSADVPACTDGMIVHGAG